VLAVPATRTVRDIPTEVVLTEEDGTPERCALSFDNVTTIPKALLTERICRLGVERLSEACRALIIASGC
jgi:mRNA interferase MazF